MVCDQGCVQPTAVVRVGHTEQEVLLSCPRQPLWLQEDPAEDGCPLEFRLICGFNILLSKAILQI